MEKKATNKKSVDNKDKTKKVAQSKKTTKQEKVASKKKGPSEKQIKINSTKIDPKTGMLIQNIKVAPKKKIVAPDSTKTVETNKIVTPKADDSSKKKKVAKKPATKKSKELTIEPAPVKPVEIVRPTPKKEHKATTKEDKVLMKQLEDSFSFVANLSSVIEERVIDKKQIPDLTIGELHVIEMVNKNNNKPITLIAKKLHITVGAFITCINRLVQKEYLLRTRDEMDHRIILLSVTNKSKKVLKAHDKFHSDILGLVLDSLTLSQASKVMNQFAEVLEEYYDPSIIEKKETKKQKSKNK
jgi:DNA-binding MarR family transcriptional regulator